MNLTCLQVNYIYDDEEEEMKAINDNALEKCQSLFLCRFLQGRC